MSGKDARALRCASDAIASAVGAPGLAAALAAGLLAGCGAGGWFDRAWFDEDTATRVEHAVADAPDPVERGGERGVAASIGRLPIGAPDAGPDARDRRYWPP